VAVGETARTVDCCEPHQTADNDPKVDGAEKDPWLVNWPPKDYDGLWPYRGGERTPV